VRIELSAQETKAAEAEGMTLGLGREAALQRAARIKAGLPDPYLERVYRHLSIADKIRLRDAVLWIERCAELRGNMLSGFETLDHFKLLAYEEPDTDSYGRTTVTPCGRAMWAYIILRDGLNEQPNT
jgi:hypothetical protein